MSLKNSKKIVKINERERERENERNKTKHNTGRWNGLAVTVKFCNVGGVEIKRGEKAIENK